MSTIKLKARPWSVAEIQAVTHVQNVSGGILYLPDLSESGEEGKGTTVRPDDVLEIASVVSEKAKVRSRSLRRGLEGVPAGTGFHEIPPTLMVVKGFDDKSLVKSQVVGDTYSKTAPVAAPENEYDILLMEQDLKEMEAEVDSEKNPTQRAQIQVSINFLKAQIAKKRETVEVGTSAGVIQTQPGLTDPKRVDSL